MRKTIYILIFLGFGINFCFSQTESEKRFGLTEFDSKKHDRIYLVQIEDYQNVELIDFKNGEFSGSLTHSVWTINRKGIRKDSIIQKITIPNSMAEKLISELNNNGFGNLKDCNEVENCISGLDGTTTFFKAIKNGEINTASYWELESDYYYNLDKIKAPAEVIKARKLISIINAEFDLSKQFQDFLNRLPIGRYSFSMQIMKKG
ncbi:hypothetical protein DFQ09_11214 [Winogradskyella pacifica]|uniref:Uncharacterized protein n=1 Tax=Winogradskyella pacifica TaxID=664642 RepID=A0A3D9LMR0_9FLAO|nr:hypothetical protein DFQ09_11214 [Winogradskyella pacifica]